MRKLLGLFLLTASSCVWAATYTVCSSGCNYTAVNSAIAVAVPGDVIQLTAGQTFDAFNLSGAHSGTAASPITIESSAVANIPAGVLVTPAFGSLSASPLLAKVQAVTAGVATITADMGATPAHDYVLIGLEVRPISSRSGSTIVLGADGRCNNSAPCGSQLNTADFPYDITFDRCWVTTSRLESHARAFAVSGDHITIENTWVDNIQSTSSSDAQAVAILDGNGHLHLYNDHLEAQTEVFSVGGVLGSGPTFNPTDIRVEQSVLRKTDWMDESVNGGFINWAATRFYPLAKVISNTAHTAYFQTTTSGTSGAAEPTWNTTQGTTTTDGTVTWTSCGTSSANCIGEDKNLFESKNSDNLLLYHSTLEGQKRSTGNGDTSQCCALTFTVRNGNFQGTPWTKVSNTRIIGNLLRHLTGELSINGGDFSQDGPTQCPGNAPWCTEALAFRTNSFFHSGDIIIPSAGPNGFNYTITTPVSGTCETGAEPTWPTTGTVVSGGCTFTAGAGVFKWSPSLALPANAYVQPSNLRYDVYWQQGASTCTTGASEPTWPDGNTGPSVGATVTDGTCTYSWVKSGNGPFAWGWTPGGPYGSIYNFELANNAFLDSGIANCSGGCYGINLGHGLKGVQIHHNLFSFGDYASGSYQIFSGGWSGGTANFSGSYPAHPIITDNIFNTVGSDLSTGFSLGYNYEGTQVNGCAALTGEQFCSDPGTTGYANSTTSCTDAFTRNAVAGATVNAATPCTTANNVPAGNLGTAWASMNFVNSSAFNYRLATNSPLYHTNANGGDYGPNWKDIPTIDRLNITTSDRAAIFDFTLSPAAASQSCSLWLSGARDMWLAGPVADMDPGLHALAGTSANDSYVINGAHRVFVVGLNQALSASTTYYYTLECGGAVTDDWPYGSSSFTTLATLTGNRTISVKYTAHETGVANILLTYGTAYARSTDTISGGSTSSTACTNGQTCTVTFTAAAGAPYYYKIQERDAGNVVLLTGDVHVEAATK